MDRAPSPRTRLLVVEDDPGVAQGLVRGLRDGGFDVELAGDGALARQALARSDVDLVVLDLTLPVVSGTELLESLRDRPHPPIIVLTARIGLDERLACFALGAVDFVPKPFFLEELVARIRARLRLAEEAPSRIVRWADVPARQRPRPLDHRRDLRAQRVRAAVRPARAPGARGLAARPGRTALSGDPTAGSASAPQFLDAQALSWPRPRRPAMFEAGRGSSRAGSNRGRAAAGLAAAALLAGAGGADASTPKVKHFDPPPLTAWKPAGCRAVPTQNPVVGGRDRWKLLHGDVLNTNEVSIAMAPVFEADWTAEPDTFNVAGVTFDQAGHLYFTPFLPHENVVLISLDPATGKRRWAIPGTGAPTGAVAPMVLNDPDHPGQEIVYVALYDRAVAVRTDGTVVWDVPTGLVLDPTLSHAAVPGINYLATLDAIVASSSDGHIYALDRKTGAQVLAAPYALPGSPTPAGAGLNLPQAIVDAVQKELAPLINFPPSSSFVGFLGAILGNGIEVSNSFSADPTTGRMWVTATAPDAADGTVDGISNLGALYGLDIAAKGTGHEVVVGCSLDFTGGSASTPALLPDGTRVYIGDNSQHLIAIDASCNQLWSVDVGGQIVGSIAVSSDNHELYAATQTSIVQVFDRGATGEIGWKAKLDVYTPADGTQQNFNLLLASIGANGIGFSAGAGLPPGAMAKIGFPLTVGYGVLDRGTGAVRYFADGLDESVAELNVGPDGAYYSPNSPIRRAFAHVLFPGDTPAVQGGIRKFAPRQQGVLVRDALCAAADRGDNALAHAAECATSAAADGVQIQVALDQVQRTGPLATADGSLSATTWACIQKDLAGVSGSDLAAATTALRLACNTVQNPSTCAAVPPAPTAPSKGCGCRVDEHAGAGRLGLTALAIAGILGRLRRRARRSAA